LKKVWAMLKKVGSRFFYLIWKSKKTFRPPQKAKILVFDGEGLNYLEPLFNGESFEVFYVREEILNLFPIILCKFLFYMVREKTTKYSYFLAYIDQVSPAIIITYIDNNQTFQKADSKNRDKGRKFIAIANGTRPLSGRAVQLKMTGLNPKDIFHSNLFCHGQCCADEYVKHGAQVENIYPVGSLLDSYFRALPRRKLEKPTFDICLIVTPFYDIPYESTWHLNGRQSCELFLSYLRVFSERNDVRISAISKHAADTEGSVSEFKWLQRLLGNSFKYFPQEDGVPPSSYIVSDDAEVVIAQASSLLRECFGRGKKILQVNYSDEPFHDFPFDGIWLLKKSGYPVFEKRLRELLLMNQADYIKQCKHYPAYFIGHNESKPAYLAISEYIQQHIQQQSGINSMESSDI
jgi:surface carbohydrate biosynthesis protein